MFLSRVFLSSTAALEDDPNAALEQAIVAEAGLRSSQVAAPKKKKQRKGATKDERDDEKVWMYHPEDEFIQKVRVPAAEELPPLLSSDLLTNAPVMGLGRAVCRAQARVQLYAVTAARFGRRR